MTTFSGRHKILVSFNTKLIIQSIYGPKGQNPEYRCMKFLTIFALILSAVLTACGGGGATGSNSSPPANEPAPQPQPQPEPQPQPQPEPEPVPEFSFTIEEFYPGYCGLDGKVENQHSGYAASGYANPDNAIDSGLNWKLNAQASGTYSLSWRYALASGINTARLLVNGSEVQTIDFATSGGWTTWIIESADVSLEPGVNTISLLATSASGLPNIDNLIVSGENVAPANCDGSAVVAMTPNELCIAGASFQNMEVDCGGARVGTACADDSESQNPVITLRNATIKNLIIAADGGADGIHCREGDCVLENVIWEDVCEDAATNRSENGSMHIKGGWAFNGTGGWGGTPDKIFQHNSKNSTTTIDSGFVARGVNGKLWRSCGNCSSNGGPRHVVIDNVRIEGQIGSVAGLNSNFGDTATITNLEIENYSAGNPPVCELYTGVQSGESSPKIGEAWNTVNCIVEQSDVSSF